MNRNIEITNVSEETRILLNSNIEITNVSEEGENTLEYEYRDNKRIRKDENTFQ